MGDVAELNALMGHYARIFQAMQKTRVGMGNRAKAIEREFAAMPEHAAIARAVTERLDSIENDIKLHLTRLARTHPMRDFVENAPGIGLPGFARLLGIVGPLDHYYAPIGEPYERDGVLYQKLYKHQRNVAKLWAYLGLDVRDGKAPRRRRGVQADWVLHGRALCRQFAESIVKAGRGPYRAAYDAKKKQYEEGREHWTQAHRHEAAMRYAVKELLKDLWKEWVRLRIPQGPDWIEVEVPADEVTTPDERSPDPT